MSPRRVKNPKGAKFIVLSYKAAAGALAIIIKHRFFITCFTKEDSRRL